ncbi:Ribonuclease H [Golovinomyces cichoracearum]|uniref:ribonuclease H n=1 Tax=Golovinomyces cichoracearum TaxID=62708 RepID=A0A420HII1_9PEZI|nr:Ribonuclease H [Golovinomyces cichoracearum]
MVYKMRIYVGGVCRGNGRPGSIAAAAAVFELPHGRQTTYSCILPSRPTPTNQRAEITAIIIALEEALERYDRLRMAPLLDVTIHSDSKYAIGCMREWVAKWCQNGWINAAGRAVANRDLIQKANRLDEKLCDLGTVEYVWIPREENVDADEACNDALDGAFYDLN